MAPSSQEITSIRITNLEKRLDTLEKYNDMLYQLLLKKKTDKEETHEHEPEPETELKNEVNSLKRRTIMS